MKKNNFSVELSTNQIFSIVAEASANLAYETYVIGGFVRDLILGRPNKDIDFVTLGSGIELAQQTATLIKHQPKVNFFKNFGTAQFNLDDYDIEFVGARKESYRTDSRKPLVEDGTLDDDQKRRDFTINALSISLNEHDAGTFYDPFNGLSDIENKIIRTPLDPDTTFIDDPLRMMRAVRFATQLNFEIEEKTLESYCYRIFKSFNSHVPGRCSHCESHLHNFAPEKHSTSTTKIHSVTLPKFPNIQCSYWRIALQLW